MEHKAFTILLHGHAKEFGYIAINNKNCLQCILIMLLYSKHKLIIFRTNVIFNTDSAYY